MKNLILVAFILVFATNVDGRERWGPPPVCPQPKVDCCPKKQCPKPCPPKPCKPKCKPVCKPKCKPVCEKPCKPCCECPPVCFERGYPTTTCCTPSAFNEPAAIDINCGWNTFITASFIYWQAMQGGMDLALPGQVAAINPLGTPTHSALGNDVLYQDFDYKPGFQVGLGWSGGKDSWMFYAEYTWLHSSTSTTATAPTPSVQNIGPAQLGQFGVWFPTWMGGNTVHTTLSSTWEYDVDILDVQVSRPFYSGMNLTFDPFFGLRALWLDQEIDIAAPVLVNTANANPATTRRAQFNSNSWGLGPRAGVNGNWLFGCGFRMIGDVSASLLYTRYTKISQDVGSDNLNLPPLRTSIDDYGCLRPNMDFSWGFGWGSYFCCRRFHWDLAATYDFNIFWDQNMMRHLADLSTAYTDGAAANFYLHGLTIKTAFEF